jgi:hypothetical protein
MFRPLTTAVDYPPMQAPASFNLISVKEQIQAAIKGTRKPVVGERALTLLRVSLQRIPAVQAVQRCTLPYRLQPN